MSPTRRDFLSGSLGLAGSTVLYPTRARGHDEHSTNDGFDPVVHAYGFRNWSPRTQYFDAPPDPTEASIQTRIRTEWRDKARALLGLETDQFPDRLIEAITTDLRAGIVQRAGTNGHCYGMVLTAQRYFEDPTAIPVDRRVASEIEDPTVPVEEPSAPVYEEIVNQQAEQFLRFRTWLGRRAMVRPEWIDVPRVLDDIKAVVDRFGTASLSVFDSNLQGHQILAYDYDDATDGTSILIYDPNRTAASYQGPRSVIRFDRTGETLSMQRYEQYSNIIFNRYDQIDRSTDRSQVSPLDHFTVDQETVREALFPLVLVTIDTEDITLEVETPAGDDIERIRGTHMDRTRGTYARVRTLYGAQQGTYRVGIFGNEPTGYQLTVTVAEPEGTIVNATQSADIGIGDFHEYEVSVPERGSGEVQRTRNRWQSPAFTGGVGVVGGAAVGAAGHWKLRQHQTQEDTE